MWRISATRARTLQVDLAPKQYSLKVVAPRDVRLVVEYAIGHGWGADRDGEILLLLGGEHGGLVLPGFTVIDRPLPGG